MELVYALCSAWFYGCSGIIDTMLVKGNNVFNIFILKQIVFFLCSLFIFFLMFNGSYKTTITQLNNFDLLLILLTGFLGIMGTYLFLYSLSKANNNYLTFGIVYTLPIIIYTILNHLFLNSPLRAHQGFGIIIVCIGLFLVSKK